MRVSCPFPPPPPPPPSQLCAAISADEARHETAYSMIVEKFFEKDPDYTMITFEDMMRKQITMPAHLMNDNQHHLKNGE